MLVFQWFHITRALQDHLKVKPMAKMVHDNSDLSLKVLDVYSKRVRRLQRVHGILRARQSKAGQLSYTR